MSRSSAFLCEGWRARTNQAPLPASSRRISKRARSVHSSLCSRIAALAISWASTIVRPSLCSPWKSVPGGSKPAGGTLGDRELAGGPLVVGAQGPPLRGPHEELAVVAEDRQHIGTVGEGDPALGDLARGRVHHRGVGLDAVDLVVLV